MAKSLFNPSDWMNSVSKIVGDIKDDDPVDQKDLQIVTGLSFVGGMLTQGMRANRRAEVAIATGADFKAFKYGLI